jgi:23S rRNA (uracil1939-C5)-methyltransferase
MKSVLFHGLAAGGDAVGRDENNRTVFVPLGAPGDRANVEIVREEKRFARGEIVELLESSAHRIAPPCPYFGPNVAPDSLSCGGCNWQHITYSHQLEAKRSMVVEALRRIGRIENVGEIVASCIASPPFAYRNKAVFAGTETAFGFHARDSHAVVDIAHCLVQRDENNVLLHAAREARAQGLTPRENWKLAARTANNGESLAIVTVASLDVDAWPRAQEFATFLMNAAPSVVGVLARAGDREGGQILAGRDWLEETVDELKFQVRGDGFFQINAPLVPTLFSTVLRSAEIRAGDAALDLFCGAGLFALGLARAGAKVWGIERARTAIEDARGNALRNRLEANFLADDTAPGMGKLPLQSWDVAVLDPPRAGAAEAIGALLRLAPRRIVYVSCDPATLARDIAALGAHYVLRCAQPLDLFPQSAHVETVALLERADSPSENALKSG